MTIPPLPHEHAVTLHLAVLGDRWESVEQITAAREHIIAAIPGWRSPAAYGVGTVDGAGRIAFARVNSGEHPLPASVLATVLGHSTGSGSYDLPAHMLRAAIRLLAPAEACTAYEHPNLAAWREVLREVLEGAEARAVFLGDHDDDTDDPGVTDLKDAIATRNAN